MQSIAFEALTSPKKKLTISAYPSIFYLTYQSIAILNRYFRLFLPDLNSHLVDEVHQGRRLQNYDSPNEVDRISHNEQSQYHLLPSNGIASSRIRNRS